MKELNPRASVGCVTTSLDAQPDTFWGDFDVMLLTYGSSKLKVRHTHSCPVQFWSSEMTLVCFADGWQTDIDALCRKKGIKLIVVRSFGLYSLVYTNFNKHEFVRCRWQIPPHHPSHNWPRSWLTLQGICGTEPSPRIAPQPTRWKK